MSAYWSGKKDKVIIEWNDLGQPVGDGAKTLSSYICVVVRSGLLPLDARFDLSGDDKFHWTLRKMGKMKRLQQEHALQMQQIQEKMQETMEEKMREMQEQISQLSQLQNIPFQASTIQGFISRTPLDRTTGSRRNLAGQVVFQERICR
ncbi:hypothetical protein QJS04_geneDACA019900 [Acorus gramineus]|uniref:Uncharacterized protein n=1 Tax=Acorus gramineus TaxID=55184 RepID=A0AAV8ZZU5_ACOGR|nr:hypothetical protein QJS04_geneDACA019900 [Acorus gramineus]